MDIKEFLNHLDNREVIRSGSETHNFMCKLSNDAMRITCRLNSSYHTPEQIRVLFEELTGREVPESFSMFPPFYTDCGKNIKIGKDVFINSGCHFQDQGGITIGDGSLIGHQVTITTLNHGFAPEDRHALYPASVTIGKGVWICAGVTIVPGVKIGDNAIVGAGAVVTKDVPSGAIVAGTPAKIVRMI